jgi:pimeloyl-ACP methyl ester carboxylesterase
MPKAKVNGVSLYYEEAGSGTPIVFVHEFAGDYRSWEAQVRFFSGRYRAVTYSARGYLPSDVPEDGAAYSQQNQIDDLAALFKHLKIEQAHVCGLSMGSYTTLLFGVQHPRLARSLTVAGSGYGSGGNREEFHRIVTERSQQMLDAGLSAVAENYTLSATRIQLQNKNPRAFAEFQQQFKEHSSRGSALTLRGVQAQRPSITELGPELEKLSVPVLVIIGDEDEPGIEGSLFMKRHIPRCGLEMFPRSGHAVNLEEPERFNRTVLDFITAVDAGHWEPRDPRSRGPLM